MGVTAAADSLAFVPFPPDLWQGILEGEDNENHVLDRAFWSAECDSTPTLLRFCGEFKRGAGNRNPESADDRHGDIPVATTGPWYE